MQKRNKHVFGTGEWAEASANNFKGCANNCHYCYAKSNFLRWNLGTLNEWSIPIPYWSSIEKIEKIKPTRVMYPASHDIHEHTLTACMYAIDRILKAGHELLIVSKPRLECISAICARYYNERDRIMFRFSIGSADDSTLRLWEPSAPCLAERLRCLKVAYSSDFKTSVSAEPMLDAEPEKIIDLCGKWVSDAIWFGKMNYPMQRLSLNRAPADVRRAAFELMQNQSDEWVKSLYERFKNNTGIKWKESIKKIVGLEIPTQKGLDI